MLFRSFLLRLIDRTAHLKGHMQDWSDTRKLKKLQKLTSAGLYELAEGKWQSAEQSLVRAGDKGENQLINYLAAARAAQAQGAYDRRDAYLRKALLTTQGADIAVGLTQAELQMQSNQLSHATVTLKQLHELAPKHNYIMQMLAEVYEKQQDWQSLNKLLPLLEKNKVVSEADFLNLEKRVAIAEIKTAAKEPTAGTLSKTWGRLAKKLRYSPDVVLEIGRASCRERV